MEAARTLTSLAERMRRHRFAEACEELRPQGVAFVLARFGQSLDRADAEDVVAEVIIRFDRLDLAGRPPDRLRPAFFQSVRNASLDLLRYRGVRPTAPLEAAEWETADSPAPEERAEARENVVRLREAMARMRPNYREAIVLRFGLGLTVPEIGTHLGISLPAAKKLVLRATAQIRARMEAIEERSFCPEMREIAERSVLDGEAAGIADDSEAAAIKAHLEHCGSCRSFLVALRSSLHELGAVALLGGLASGKVGLGARLASHFHSALQGTQAGVGRARLASYRLGGALRAEGGADSAGLLAGTGQKIAAVCTAGVAGAATCAATGIIGPGIGVAPHGTVHHPPRPVAQIRKATLAVHKPLVTYRAPTVVEPEEPSTTASSPAPGVAPHPRHTAASAGSATAHQAKPKAESSTEAEAPTPEGTEESQFGIETESSSAGTGEAASSESSAPVAEARAVESTPTPAPSPSSTKSSSGGHDEFGFGG